MTHTLADLRECFLGLEAEQTPHLARGGGAYADLFVEERESWIVRLESGAVVRVARESDRGFAVRAISHDGLTRIATSTSLDQHAALALAKEIAFPGLSDRAPHPADRPPPPPRWVEVPARVRPETVSLDRRIALAELADRTAREVSPHIREVSVSLRDGVRRTALAGSDGRAVASELVRAVAAVEVIATDGAATQSAFEAIGGAGGLELLDEDAVAACARITAERAVKMLLARPAPAGEMAVVLAGEAGGTFVHEAVGHSLEADLVLDGLSALGTRMGEAIAVAAISVADDATLAAKNGTFACDDEGIDAARTLLIDRGVLVSLLHDRRSALLLGKTPTGNGRRESFRHRPIVRMSNTMIVPGADDPAAIVRDTPRGLYVVRMGGGEVDTVTGHFVFEVSEAYVIERGVIGEPVRGATLTGDCIEVLMSIDRVGSDLGFGIGICGKDGQDVPVADGEPTIRIPSLVVGGA